MADARLELWETLCTCGGARKSPDVRMCSCLAPMKAGLDCEGCGRGVLLIKESYKGNVFWGCSMYKKKGCKFTKRYGYPYDSEAAQKLASIRQRREAQGKRELEEIACIVDPLELEWRNSCECGGASHLDTFECYMRSEGGCGLLPLCPKCGNEWLFLKNGRYGKYWQCHDRSRRCKFSASYKPHKTPDSSPPKKIPRTSVEGSLARRPIQDVSNNKSAGVGNEELDQKPPAKKELDQVVSRTPVSDTPTASTPTAAARVTTSQPKPIVLSAEQRAMIEVKRQAALAKCRRRLLDQQSAAASPSTASVTVKQPSPQPVAQQQQQDKNSTCKIPQNEALYQAFCELTNLYHDEGNYNAQACYYKVSEAIRGLDYEVTAENAKSLGIKGKAKLKNVGKASADKMYEFLTMGTMKKLEEKRARKE